MVLKNEGPLSVEIVSLWVIDATMNKHNFSSSLNINLKPGNITYLQGSKAINVTIVGSAPLHQFSSWFVTARGNVVPSEREGGIIVAQVSAGIGSVSMDFASFIYYNVTKVGQSYILENYTNGGEGYTVSFAKDIAFKVCLSNFDQNKREIKLFSGSMLWMLFPVQATQPRSIWWYIVNVYDNGTIASTYTTITLTYGAPTWVFFASANDISSPSFNPSPSGISGVSSIKLPSPAAVNLMLVGRIGASTYGQNVPFVSIYVNP